MQKIYISDVPPFFLTTEMRHLLVLESNISHWRNSLHGTATKRSITQRLRHKT
jgi:hypothetical protein